MALQETLQQPSFAFVHLMQPLPPLQLPSLGMPYGLPQLFQSLVTRYNPRLLQPYAMAPHLTPAELDFIQEKERLGKDVLDMYAALKSRREKKGIAVPHITNFRKVLKGKTYKRSQKETRGRKRKFTKRMVLKMNSVRKNLIKKAENEREVLLLEHRA